MKRQSRRYGKTAPRDPDARLISVYKDDHGHLSVNVTDKDRDHREEFVMSDESFYIFVQIFYFEDYVFF